MFHGGLLMSARLAWVLSAALLVPVAGCHHKAPPKTDFNGELPPGQVALRKIPLEKYPDFSKCAWNLPILTDSIDHSISYLNKPSSQAGFPYLDISHDRAMATVKAFREMVETAKTQSDAGSYINNDIRARFEVYQSVGAPNPEGPGFTDKVLFTGYFTPIYDASLRREGPYQWPVYRKPKDLKIDLATGETAVPYLTRQQIEQGNALAGLELAYFKTRWEAYVVTIQGSARLRLPNGQMMEIGYAGNNGREYTSPRQQMLADGVMTKENWSGPALRDYFNTHPEMADRYFWINERYVFFTERPGGPFGALNEQVTNWATIATDKTLDPIVHMTIYPRAMPAFLNVPVPSTDNPGQKWQFQGFMMDQDTGGGIRAAGRADIYMGVGAGAEELSGHQYDEGALYYIAIKPEYVGQYVNAPIGPRPATRPGRRGA